MQPKFSARFLILSTLLALIFSVVGTTPAKAAGIITHAEVVERAIELVDEQAYPELVAMLKKYRGLVTYSSMFSDWGYTVFDGDLAEVVQDACSQPTCSTYGFRKTLATRLVSAFRNPQSEDDRKAIAFLFGLIAHQETDNPWHFSQSGSPLAFEPALSLQNAKLGTVVEFATELPLARNLLGIENMPEFWYPAEALLAAYKDVGRDDVSADDLNVGKDRQATQYYAEIYAAFLARPRFRRITDSPFIFLLETYPPGGLNDAARLPPRRGSKPRIG
jgi:hypothetical protein